MKDFGAELAPPLPGRLNIYHRIHKALRSFMADTLQRVGRMDLADAQERDDVLTQVHMLADFCQGHLNHENQFVHSAMEMRRPLSAATTSEDHVHHVYACKRLSELAVSVERSPTAAHMSQLYTYLALFMAENLVHMNLEETENNAVLWATHTDAELFGIEQAIVASLSQEEAWLSMRWMVPALSPAERVVLLDGVRRNAPAAVFAGLLGGLKPFLAPIEWTKLSEGLRQAA